MVFYLKCWSIRKYVCSFMNQTVDLLSQEQQVCEVDLLLVLILTSLMRHFSFKFTQRISFFCVFREEDDEGAGREGGHWVGPLLHVSQGWLFILSQSNYAYGEANWNLFHMIHISIETCAKHLFTQNTVLHAHSLKTGFNHWPVCVVVVSRSLSSV